MQSCWEHSLVWESMGLEPCYSTCPYSRILLGTTRRLSVAASRLGTLARILDLNFLPQLIFNRSCAFVKFGTPGSFGFIWSVAFLVMVGRNCVSLSNKFLFHETRFLRHHARSHQIASNNASRISIHLLGGNSTFHITEALGNAQLKLPGTSLPSWGALM